MTKELDEVRFTSESMQLIRSGLRNELASYSMKHLDHCLMRFCMPITTTHMTRETLRMSKLLDCLHYSFRYEPME